MDGVGFKGLLEGGGTVRKGLQRGGEETRSGFGLDTVGDEAEKFGFITGNREI